MSDNEIREAIERSGLAKTEAGIETLYTLVIHCGIEILGALQSLIPQIEVSFPPMPQMPICPPLPIVIKHDWQRNRRKRA